MKTKFSFIILLILSIQLMSAQTNQIDSLRTEVRNQLEVLSMYPYQSIESEEELDFACYDPDSLVSVIKDGILELFRLDAPSVHQEYCSITSNDSNICVIDINYRSGGTMGSIPAPIVIKKENGRLRIFDLTETECSFQEFYRLKDQTYLCIGYWPKPASWCVNQVICVIDFSQSEAVIKPIFNGERYFALCNTEFSFDTVNKILEIEVEAIPTFGSDCEKYFHTIKGIAEIECESYKGESETEVITVSIKFRFNGDQLVKL